MLTEGRENEATRKNPRLLEAEKVVQKLDKELGKHTGQLKKAQSEAHIVTEFRDLVRKGKEQFRKELEAVAPEVKIGQHGKDALTAVFASVSCTKFLKYCSLTI